VWSSHGALVVSVSMTLAGLPPNQQAAAVVGRMLLHREHPDALHRPVALRGLRPWRADVDPLVHELEAELLAVLKGPEDARPRLA
jgi:hypothetical protein